MYISNDVFNTLIGAKVVIYFVVPIGVIEFTTHKGINNFTNYLLWK